MPVSGLVITLCDLAPLRETAIGALAANPDIVVGELQTRNRLPVVTDTQTIQAQNALWEDMARLPGVLLVELAYHDFSDVDAFEPVDAPRRAHRHGDLP